MGMPNANVLPEPVGDAARTSTPARASGKTSAWMANGDLMLRRPSASTTGALTPSAANDWIMWWFLPVSGFEMRETRDACKQEEREAGSLGAEVAAECPR